MLLSPIIFSNEVDSSLSIFNFPIVSPSNIYNASFAIILVTFPIEIPTKWPVNELPSSRLEHIIPLNVELAKDIPICLALFLRFPFVGFSI